jgi:hypothetical protein
VAIGSRRVVFLLGGREGVVSATVAKEAKQELVRVRGLDVMLDTPVPARGYDGSSRK